MQLTILIMKTMLEHNVEQHLYRRVRCAYRVLLGVLAHQGPPEEQGARVLVDGEPVSVLGVGLDQVVDGAVGGLKGDSHRVRTSYLKWWSTQSVLVKYS